MLRSHQTVVAVQICELPRTPSTTVVGCTPLQCRRSPHATSALQAMPVTLTTQRLRVNCPAFPVDIEGLRSIIVGVTEQLFTNNSTNVVAALAFEQGDRCRCTMAPETCTTK